MNVTNYPIPQTLLEIARAHPECRHSQRRNTSAPRNCFARMRQLLPDHSLTDEDYVLIALLFERFLERGKRVDARDLADRIHPDSVRKLQVFQQIRRLVGKGLLELRGMRTRGHDRNRPAEDRFSMIKMVESEVLLREPFLQQLIGEQRRTPAKSQLPFADNPDFLDAWFTYIRARKSYRDASTWDLFTEQDNSDEDAAFRDAKAELDSRLALTSERFPLQELIEEEGLDDKERDVVLYLLSEELQDHTTSLDEMIDLISEDQFERHQNRAYFDRHSRLISRGILEVSEETFFMTMKRSEVRLASDVSRRLMSRSPESDRERLEIVMQGQDLFELADPTQSFDNLILPAELKQRLETSVKRYRSKADLRLREWGIDRGRSDGRRDFDEAPLLMLFSGPSGTGKSFAAGAFAARLGKQLLVTDVSRVLSAYVGASEQNLSRMFHLFDKLVRRMENPPVLLLNECDQFLLRRGESSKSVDRMYHQMQNLFLEAFERLRGILIATTNLAEGLDPAFSRRFHLKLELPLPDEAARTQLWRIHLPETLPLANDVRVERLAHDYPFSGGQIALAVRNAAIMAAVRSSAVPAAHREGKVTMSDLIEACDGELLGAQKVMGLNGRKMGFVV